MSGYPYQSIDHDASISAERDPDDPDRVRVEIVVGDLAEARFTFGAGGSRLQPGEG